MSSSSTHTQHATRYDREMKPREELKTKRQQGNKNKNQTGKRKKNRERERQRETELVERANAFYTEEREKEIKYLLLSCLLSHLGMGMGIFLADRRATSKTREAYIYINIYERREKVGERGERAEGKKSTRTIEFNCHIVHILLYYMHLFVEEGEAVLWLRYFKETIFSSKHACI